MKKKNLNLGKKLILNKETLVSLNQDQMGNLLGGAPVTRFSCNPDCVTFATIHPGEQFCRPCELTN